MIIKGFKTKDDTAYYLMKSVRKKGAKSPTKAAVEYLGLHSELAKEHDDVKAYLDEYARKKTQECKDARESGKKLPTSIGVDFGRHIDFSDNTICPDGKYGSYIHMGQMPLLRLYHFLEIDEFLARKRRSWGIESGMEVIYKLLIIGRVVIPASKLHTWNNMSHFRLGYNRPSDDVMYDALAFIGSSAEDMIIHLNDVIRRKRGRDTSILYYDVTNYYVEVDDPDNLIDGDPRHRGCSKEHRPEPIIQMGLFMDADGLPLSFGLFPGNTNDVETFLPMLDKMNEAYDLRRMIYVADKGMMSYDNIGNIIANGCGYIISDSPRRKQEQSLMKFLLSQDGYIEEADGEFKYKSRQVPLKRSVTYRGDDGKQKTVTIQFNEVQIVFWSRKYARKAKHERDEAIAKIQANPTVFDNYKAKAFFDKIPMKPESGEIIEGIEFDVPLNKDKLAEAEALDGYYILKTNVIGRVEGEEEWKGRCRYRKDYLFQLNEDVTEKTIIDMYRGLWEIEETFKITKSFLSTRPIYVRKGSSIRAHFMTCFIALLMVRLIEKDTKGRLNHSQVIDALQESIAAEIDSGIYKNIISSKAMEEIGKAYKLDLIKQWYTEDEIRKMSAKPKED